MNDTSKEELLNRIEYILSSILSNKHNMNIKIGFKRER